MKKRVEWIDAVRSVAVISLILEHLFGILYTNSYIRQHLSFSVELFVLAGGYTTALTLSKSKKYFKYISLRLFALLAPYALASLLHHLYFRGGLEFSLFLKQVLSFSATGIFYFVFFYVQLLIVSGLLFWFFNKKPLIFQLSMLGLIYLTSALLTDKVHISSLYGAGGILFGGTYLFLFCFGMFIYAQNKRLKIIHIKLLGTGVVIAMALYEGAGLYSTRLTSPPHIYQIIYSITIFVAIFCLDRLIPILLRLKHVKTFLFLGKNSFYIYLYHYLALYIGARIISHFSQLAHIYKFLLPFIAVAVPLLVQEMVKLLNHVLVCFWKKSHL